MVREMQEAKASEDRKLEVAVQSQRYKRAAAMDLINRQLVNKTQKTKEVQEMVSAQPRDKSIKVFKIYEFQFYQDFESTFELGNKINKIIESYE